MVDNVRDDRRVFVGWIGDWSETQNMREYGLGVFSRFEREQVNLP